VGHGGLRTGGSIVSLEREESMGHAAGLGRAHQDLAKRLLRGPVAMVEPQDPAARRAWREILETLFSPDDAALAARLPVVPTTLADLARHTGMGEGGLRALDLALDSAGNPCVAGVFRGKGTVITGFEIANLPGAGQTDALVARIVK